MIYTKSTFTDEEVLLDGNEYRDCIFNKCRLVFRGEKPPVLSGNRLNDSRFVFLGPAELTLNFLKELARPTSGISEIVKQSFPELFPS